MPNPIVSPRPHLRLLVSNTRTLATGLLAIPFAVAAQRAVAAPACPAFLDRALHLLVVTTRNQDATAARLRLFSRDRPGTSWRQDGTAESAVVGRHGLAWGDPFRDLARPGEPVKREGDGRSPAGIFAIGRSFGHAPLARANHLTLRPKSAYCVDDPASPAYNTILAPSRSGPAPRGEDMGAEPLYRRGLVIDYPSDAGRRAGSCIFLHVWRGPSKGTAGCVALPEARVAALQNFAQDGAAIAILPEDALGHFAGCLPKFEAE